MSYAITNPIRIDEEFQVDMAEYCMCLEDMGAPGADQFWDKLCGLHSGGFTLDEAMEIIAEFERGLAGTPDAGRAHGAIEGLRRLYRSASGPSPEFTES